MVHRMHPTGSLFSNKKIDTDTDTDLKGGTGNLVAGGPKAQEVSRDGSGDIKQLGRNPSIGKP
jgi:hypothetical protein